MCLTFGCTTSEELTVFEERQQDTITEPVEDEMPEVETAVETAPEDSERADLEEQKLAIEENRLKMQFQREANNITHLYVTAQQLFYNGNSEQALILIQQANEIRDNADVKALKGSIYLSLGYRTKFEENWREAFELDPSVPVPPIPAIERELKSLGLID